ncbi:MAG: CPBP family intramembrane metalloprotease [Lachnospiraceae bacterium]|nr:CPBP family intramembrane metalloprotease [Lachnospiraceae bacterium]
MNERTAKQNFSTMGLSLFVFLIVVSALQIGISAVVQAVSPADEYPSWAFWLVNFVPMYCVGLPLCYFMMKKVPAEDLVETTTFTAGRWFKFLILSFFVMVIGNLIGTAVAALFSLVGINSNATVDTLMSQTSWVGIIVLAIIGPIVEEFIFRKWLIDRMHVYGGSVAVVTSALMFGLFHGNFAQFFYAFFLGLVWGYVYYKTGKVIYSALMHMTINFCGGVIAPWLISGLDLTDPAALAASPKYIGYMVYEVIVIVLAIVGLVFFIRGRKSIAFAEERLQLPKEDEKKTPWCNVGMMLFLIGCLALFVVGLVGSYIANAMA